VCFGWDLTRWLGQERWQLSRGYELASEELSSVQEQARQDLSKGQHMAWRLQNLGRQELNMGQDQARRKLNRALEKARRELSRGQDPAREELKKGLDQARCNLSRGLDRAREELSRGIDRAKQEMSRGLDQARHELLRSLNQTRQKMPGMELQKPDTPEPSLRLLTVIPSRQSSGSEVEGSGTLCACPVHQPPLGSSVAFRVAPQSRAAVAGSSQMPLEAPPATLMVAGLELRLFPGSHDLGRGRQKFKHEEPTLQPTAKRRPSGDSALAPPDPKLSP
jgi:hypothetical protein